jgi:hypothetical protein
MVEGMSQAPGDPIVRLRRLARKARAHAASRVYWDRGGDSRKTILISGVARSGTTWIAESLCRRLSARLIFEPFYPERVHAYRHFEYLQYMRPDAENSRLEHFAGDVFRGRIREATWVDKMPLRLFPQARVVKDVRTGLMLGWLHERFPQVASLFVIRHPCSIVASFLRRGWDARLDIASIRRQSQLIEDHLSDQVHLIERKMAPHQAIALAWCVNNLVAQRQCSGSGVVVFHYEDLVRQPRRVAEKIFDRIGHGYGHGFFRALDRPSGTTTRGAEAEGPEDRIRGWRLRLTAAQIDDVFEIVAAFRLNRLYDDQGYPAVAPHLPT